MNEIDHVRQSEEGNYQLAQQALGQAFLLTQDIPDLYQLLVELAKGGGVEPRDEIVTGLHFLVACRYQFTMASLAICRGHLIDSYLFSRRAIELCAFAARVKKHPHLAMVWLRAADDDASYQTYRKKFSTGKLFLANHRLLQELGRRYGQCSKLSHPSLYSLSLQSEATRTDTTLSVRLQYFQVRENDPTEPLLTFLLCVDTHFGILRVFEEVLDDVVAQDPTRWAVQRDAVDARLDIQKARLKQIWQQA